MKLEVEKKIDGGTVTLLLTGALNTETAPELAAVLDSCASDADEIIFDLAGLNYLSSAGVRLFLSVHKYMMSRGGMQIVHVDDDVISTLVLMGFMGTFNIS